MTAFFALLAGLAIGFILGLLYVGYMIAACRSVRKYFMDLCEDCEDEDI